MAGNESTPGSLAEDSLSTRLQWLRQRREALQEKLAQKNNELKNLCVEEAELTGVLPPEIPLEPGESPPVFRKRVGTAFTYPQNLINKLKTNEVEESALELERQVQIGIVEAALGIVNDPMESKAVRRKHRLVYQQSQRRLQELEARLNFLRQSRNKTHHSAQLQHPTICNAQPHLHANVKHRTKKPRPPLDGTEGGISLSPLGSEDKCNTYPNHGYDDQSLLPNTCNHNHIGTYCPTISDQRQSIKIIEHDHNDNQNVYILSDQYRTRTYSHGSGGSRTQNLYHDSERMYRPLPNAYTEDERHIRYRPFQQEQVHNYQQYSDYKHLDNDVQRRSGQEYYERDFRTLHYTHIPEFPVYHKSNSQSQSVLRRDRDTSTNKNLRYTDSPNELPSGYWMRYEDEIVWCTDDQPVSDRFGSLDRRKRNAVQHTSIGTDIQPRYRTVSVGCSKNSTYIASHQNASVHLLPLSEQSSTNNKMLLRTQSLGSVEKWHSNHLHELHDSKDTIDNIGKKGREKEWYETSLDSGTSPGSDINLISSHKNIHYQATLPVCSKSSTGSNGEDGKSNYIPSVNHRKSDILTVETDQHLQPLSSRYEPIRKKVLEIPAESKSPQETNEETIMLGSSQNCTIVQAGKYQPYREVTKPFEMSDFYKYSTKFRKRNEISGQNVSNETQDDSQGSHYIGANDILGETESSNTIHNGSIASSVQKRIYQPVQRMTCQPYLTSLR
ncbi:FERM domain-containing protein 4A [Eufriesea mexicana]|uniref:FERM domain-containing protein 4A n=1 Tax=Eufriesea mexicana TaxID=516756 RepID=A0A310S6V9_9HYME|nr:FERM domain-containing protein 4A [Eufriesea mexicana]